MNFISARIQKAITPRPTTTHQHNHITTMALRRIIAASSRTSLSSIRRASHANQSLCSLPSLMESSLNISHNSKTTVNTTRFYSSTSPTQKVFSLNSDLSESEIQAIIDKELSLMEEEKLEKEYRNWKPGQRKRPLVMSRRLEDFEEEASGTSKWTLRDKRCGALGI